MSTGGRAPVGSAEGVWVYLEPLDPAHRPELDRLDWLRSQLPEMGGWSRRPPPTAPWASTLFRSRATGELLGVIDAIPLPGYPGVVNVSIFTDTAGASPGWAMDAYGLCVAQLFEQGVRLVHHEVLELNRPVQRILRGIGLRPSACFREHAYVAGRMWDVLVFSFDREHWKGVLTRFSQRRVGRTAAGSGGPTQSGWRPSNRL